MRDGDGCLAQEKSLRIRPSLGGSTSWLSVEGDRQCSEVPLSLYLCEGEAWEREAEISVKFLQQVWLIPQSAFTLMVT